jgi:uncharacterized membrane protein YsdA (DUF1294 family)
VVNLAAFLTGLLLCVAAAAVGPVIWVNPVITYLAGINSVAFLYYGLDKAAAIRSWPRLSECLLHVAALCGGSPGAYFGQHIFNHKMQKRRFQIVFWTTVTVQVAGVVIFTTWTLVVDA